MAMLLDLYKRLTDIVLCMKKKLVADDVEEFVKLLNDTIPTYASEEYIRYDEFHMLFNLNRKAFGNMLVRSKEPKVRSRVLWTNSFQISNLFGIRDLLDLKWERQSNTYYVQLKKKIAGLSDPRSQGYSFEYCLDIRLPPSSSNSSNSPSLPDRIELQKLYKSDDGVGYSPVKRSFEESGSWADALDDDDEIWVPPPFAHKRPTQTHQNQNKGGNRNNKDWNSRDQNSKNSKNMNGWNKNSKNPKNPKNQKNQKNLRNPKNRDNRNVREDRYEDPFKRGNGNHGNEDEGFRRADSSGFTVVQRKKRGKK